MLILLLNIFLSILTWASEMLWQAPHRWPYWKDQPYYLHRCSSEGLDPFKYLTDEVKPHQHLPLLSFFLFLFLLLLLLLLLLNSKKLDGRLLFLIYFFLERVVNVIFPICLFVGYMLIGKS